jgi:hypothetical protein
MHREAGEARRNPFRQHSIGGLWNEEKCFIDVKLEMIEERKESVAPRFSIETAFHFCFSSSHFSQLLVADVEPVASRDGKRAGDLSYFTSIPTFSCKFMFDPFRGTRAIIGKWIIQSFEVPVPVLVKTSNKTLKNELYHHLTMHTSELCQSPLPGVAKNNCIAYNQNYHVAQIGTRSPVSQNAHRMQTFSTLFTM